MDFFCFFVYLRILIHETDPQSRPVVIIVFAHVVRSYVRPSPLFITKQNSNKNNVRYWRDCGSGRVDHWWHTCLVLFIFLYLELLCEITKRHVLANFQTSAMEKWSPLFQCQWYLSLQKSLPHLLSCIHSLKLLSRKKFQFCVTQAIPNVHYFLTEYCHFLSKWTNQTYIHI